MLFSIVYRSSFFLALAVSLLGASLCTAQPPSAAKAPPVGEASGTFMAKGKTYKLTHASAFVDKKDNRKPVVLLLTDQPIPQEVLSGDESPTSYRMAQNRPFNGVAFYLDQQRTVFRCDTFEGDFGASVSGLLELKLDGPAGKSFAGSARSNAAAAKQKHPIKLDVTFNAIVK